VIIRLPKLTEADYAGQTVARLNKDLNPQAATKLDLNFQGRDSLADLLYSLDPDSKGTLAHRKGLLQERRAEHHQQRSEVGIFTSISQATRLPA